MPVLVVVSCDLAVQRAGDVELELLGAELVLRRILLLVLALFFNELRIVVKLALVDQQIGIAELHVLLLLAPLVGRVSGLFAAVAFGGNIVCVEIADPDVVEFVPLV